MMQTNIFVQLIFSLIFSGSRIANCYLGYEWQEPYYKNHVLQKSNEPVYSERDEYYSLRGHDKRPGDFYFKGSVPLETSKESTFCSKALHNYIENCIGSCKLRKIRKEDFPYYDIRTHAERDIEQEILTQKFVEILHKLVMLKVADEMTYDQRMIDNDIEDYNKNQPSLYYSPKAKSSIKTQIVTPKNDQEPLQHSSEPKNDQNESYSKNTPKENVGQPVESRSKLNETKTISNESMKKGDIKIKLYRKWKLYKFNSEILNKTSTSLK